MSPQQSCGSPMHTSTPSPPAGAVGGGAARTSSPRACGASETLLALAHSHPALATPARVQAQAAAPVPGMAEAAGILLEAAETLPDEAVRDDRKVAVASKPSPTAEQRRLLEEAAHSPFKKRGLHKLRGGSPTTASAAAAGTTIAGARNPSVDETDLIRGILRRSRTRQNASPADGTAAAAKSPPATVALQPWSSVTLSAKAERALQDLRSDWEEWVAPFTASGIELRKRRREAELSKSGRGMGTVGEDGTDDDGSEAGEGPRKRPARAVANMKKPQGFCHGTDSSLILPSTPPKQLLNALLACRGFSSRTRSSLPTYASRRAFANPSPLRVASHGSAVLQAVRAADPCALASLLHCGLHNDPCDASGTSTLLSHVCASSDLTLFWVVTEAYGIDAFGPDAQGRTALHHLCAAQTADPPGAFWTAVYMILERDWRALRIADNDGKTPLDLAPKGSWPAWNRYLHSVVEHYWSRPRDGPDAHYGLSATFGKSSLPNETLTERRRKLAREETEFERGVAQRAAKLPQDPTGAVPVDVARAVASGAIQPDAVVQMRRKVEARAQLEEGGRKLAAASGTPTLTAVQAQAGQAQARAQQESARRHSSGSAPAPAAAVLAAATAIAQAQAHAAVSTGHRMLSHDAHPSSALAAATAAARRNVSLPPIYNTVIQAQALSLRPLGVGGIIPQTNPVQRETSLPPIVMEVAARAAASLAVEPLTKGQASVARVAAMTAARFSNNGKHPGGQPLDGTGAGVDGEGAAKRSRTTQEPRTYAGRSA